MDKQRLKTSIVTALAAGASRLPMPVLYGISSGLSALMSRFRIYRYKVIEDNLRKAMPELSDRERKKVIKRYYGHLADSIVETLKLLSISDKELKEKVEFHGFEQLDADVAAGRPVILYLGHYGNWELVPAITWVLPKEFTCAQIYRPFSDGASSEVIYRIRNRFGALNIPQRQAFRTLVRLKNEGKQTITGFIADQRPNEGGDRLQHWTTFMGLDTPFAPGGEEIGNRIGARFYYLDVDSPKRGHCSITLVPIVPAEGEEYPYTVAYMRMLEKTIRRNPALWLWSHKRWSIQRQKADANENDKTT